MQSPIPEKKRKHVAISESEDKSDDDLSTLLSPIHAINSLHRDEEAGSIHSPFPKKTKSAAEGKASFITSSPLPKSKALLRSPRNAPKAPENEHSLSSLRRRPTSRNLASDFASALAVAKMDNEESENEPDASSQESTPSSSPQRKKKSAVPIFSPGFHLYKDKSHAEDVEESEDSQSVPPTELSTQETLPDLPVEPEKFPERSSETLYDPYNLEDDEEEDEEFEEFDPYLFISGLPQEPPELTHPIALPPKDPNSPPITLVLDLDETLVHCSTEPMDDAELIFPVDFNGVVYQIYVRVRPYFEHFLREVSSKFETIIFTASQEVYASTLLDILDKNKYIKHRVYRDSCVVFDGNYLKDLNVLGRDLSKVMIVDNSPQAFGFQLSNGIPIESWFDDPDDKELLNLLPFLDKLSKSTDVRPLIEEEFKLHEKVEKYLS